MTTVKTKKRVYTQRKTLRPVPVSRVRSVARFLPAAALFFIALSIHSPAAAKKTFTAQVLSYATSVSQSDLLSQTNTQRSSNGVGSLTLNTQLSNAAQTKANDMVTRDYWSHVTPDGKQPWDFITAAGYQYTTAGENLAYGFDSSTDTVTGWMNSPPHRENLLNNAFKDVGFGFANSANYVGSGAETVVVAMYAAPQQAAAAPAASTTPVAAAQTKGASSTKPPAANVSSEPIQTTPAEVPATAEQAKATTQPVAQTPASSIKTLAAKPSTVSRIQLLTGGNAAWSRNLLVASIAGVAILWFIQRGFQIRRMLMAGEHFFLKHAHIDLTIFGFITLGWTLLQATGSVR